MNAAVCSAMTLLMASAIGCTPTEPDVRFEVRGLTTKSDESEYGTSFTHQASLIAMGDSADAHRPYFVILRVHRLSGGDPDESWNEPVYATTLVHDGAGEVAVSGGYRGKRTSYSAAETWEPMKIELSVVGYVPLLTPERGRAPPRP